MPSQKIQDLILVIISSLFLLLAVAKLYGDEATSLTVGMELGYPPFEMVDSEGRPTGISVEIAQALGQFLNKKIKFENIPFVGLIPALKTEKIDLIISSMSITEQRKQSILFSDPYLTVALCLLVSKKSPLKSIEEANQPHFKFVVKSGTSGEVYAREHLTKAQVIVLDKETSCVLEVVQGKVDAFIYDQLSVFQNWQKNFETTRALLEPIAKENWGIGVNKDNPELLKKINEFIKTFKEEDGIKKIIEKYLWKQLDAFQQMNIPFIF